MDIGWAMCQLREGRRVRRRCWDGHLVLGWPKKLPVMTLRGEPVDLDSPAKVYWADRQEDLRVLWACSQPDLFAADWELAE